MTRNTRIGWALVLTVAGGLLGWSPAVAGFFFTRTPKPSPAEQIPKLVTTLKSDQAERKRADAAEGLGDFDLAPFPEAVDALVQALRTDVSAAVRGQALHSLSRLKAPPKHVVAAVEQCKTSDASIRLRAHAQRLWMSYQLHGLTPKPDETAAPPTAQSPAGSVPPEPARVMKSTPTPPASSRFSRLFPWSSGKPTTPAVPAKETAAPPLASSPPAAEPPVAAEGTLEPMDRKPLTLSPVPKASEPGAMPVEPPRPADGPELTIPQ